MTYWICKTCGTQFDDSPSPPTACLICEDERQYVNAAGQGWTTSETLQQEGHENLFEEEGQGLTSIRTSPKLPIGQRALLISTSQGNVLWDCITFLDAATVDKIKARGGLKAIVISHPHYYTTMVEWAEAFQCPVMIHGRDRQHVMRPSKCIMYFSEDTKEIVKGVTAIRLGGHFTGSLVLHCSTDHDAQPFLCTGDTIFVIPDQNPKPWVSFMYSYPCLIPLPADQVARIRNQMSAWEFDKIYGAFPGHKVKSGGKDAVMRSADRYVGILDGSISREYF